MSKAKSKKISPAVAGQPWAMREEALRALATTSARVPTDYSADDGGQGYDVIGNVAVIQMVGPMVKYADIWQQIFGGVSTVETATALQQANADPSVVSILLAIDSPGGMVAGTGDLASSVASSAKPVTAYVSDMACSAAYWVASQASSIVANPTATIGSIGVYTVVEDTSRMYEDAGVKVNLVKAGNFKGTGVDGVPVTQDQIDNVQKEVNAIYDVFVNNVAKGRSMNTEDASKLATGETWLAPEAQSLGLVDKVDSLENTINNLVNSSKVLHMANKKIKVPAATVATEVIAKEIANMENVVETTEPTVATAVEPVAEKVEVIEVDKAKFEKAVADAVDAEKLVSDAKAEAFAAGVKAEQDRFAALSKMAKNHPAFAIEQYAAGSDLATAAAAYGDFLATQAEQAKNLDPSSGTNRLNLATKAVTAGDVDSDWTANVGGCQKTFGSLRNYKAYRKWEDKVGKMPK